MRAGHTTTATTITMAYSVWNKMSLFPVHMQPVFYLESTDRVLNFIYLFGGSGV
jgi:hypothetical protein